MWRTEVREKIIATFVAASLCCLALGIGFLITGREHSSHHIVQHYVDACKTTYTIPPGERVVNIVEHDGLPHILTVVEDTKPRTFRFRVFDDGNCSTIQEQ